VFRRESVFNADRRDAVLCGQRNGDAFRTESAADHEATPVRSDDDPIGAWIRCW
jgi:hypothetical protein